jgi:S1-C subfamily serine protease
MWEDALPICLENGDPDVGSDSPLFPAVCLVLSPKGFGTGFFLGERAQVITARHVVRHEDDSPGEPAAKVMICWIPTGRGFLFIAPAVIVRDDWRTDLALLRLEKPEELPTPLSCAGLTMLGSSPAMLRDRVFFEAFRTKDAGGFEFRRIRARVMHARAVAPGGLEQRIMTLDASAWPGASGAPVFSTTGDVVGIVTDVMRDTGETIIRDARWILHLWDAEHGSHDFETATPVIHFPERPPARYNMGFQAADWSQRLRRLAQAFLR